MTKQKLTKSRSNRVLTGALGGIAEYLGWSPRILRIAYLIGSILTLHFMLGLWVYLLLMVLIPSQNTNDGLSSWVNLFGNMNRDYGRNASNSRPNNRKILHDVEEKDDRKR